MLALAFSYSRHPAISLQSAEVDVTKRDSISVAYENRTKSEKCGGLETNGPRERISDSNGVGAVRGFAANPAVIGVLSALKSQRRMLAADGLAEGERLYSNVLSQVCAAALRCNSKRFYATPPTAPTPIAVTK